MGHLFLRLWKRYDISEVQNHLLLMGDTSGDCAKCRAFGIDPWKATECPECHTPFKFISSRRITSYKGERFGLAKRFYENRSDLQMIDYEDYQKAIGDKKARDFFS